MSIKNKATGLPQGRKITPAALKTGGKQSTDIR
jgi:hypothetical protein